MEQREESPRIDSTVFWVAAVLSAIFVAWGVFFADSLAAFLKRRPAWLRVQRYVTGTLLGVFAVKLATDRSRVAAA